MTSLTRAGDVQEGSTVALPKFYTKGMENFTELTIDKAVENWPEPGYLTWHDYKKDLALEIHKRDFIEVIQRP